MPYVAHKRLVTVIHIPYHTVYYGGTLIPIRVHTRIRPSVIAAELNRIRNLTRPSTESYVEKYLQSKDHIVSLPKISSPISLFQRKEKKKKRKQSHHSRPLSTSVGRRRRRHHHYHHPCHRDTSDHRIIHASSHLFTITTHCSSTTSGIIVRRNRVVFFTRTSLNFSRLSSSFIYIHICIIILSILQEFVSITTRSMFKIIEICNLSHLVTPRLYFSFDRFNRITKRSLLLAIILIPVLETEREPLHVYFTYLSSQYFDDEAREIRARVDSLLRRVHIFVPRAVARYI